MRPTTVLLRKTVFRATTITADKKNNKMNLDIQISGARPFDSQSFSLCFNRKFRKYMRPHFRPSVAFCSVTHFSGEMFWPCATTSPEEYKTCLGESLQNM